MDKEDKKKSGFPNLLGRVKTEAPPHDRSRYPDKVVQEPPPKASVKEVSESELPPPPRKQQTETIESPQSTRMKDDEITNHISADLSEQDKKEIYDAIDVIRRKLSFAKDFNDDERKSLMHLGQTGRNFVDRAQNLVQRSPGILPRSFDIDEFHRDAELYQELGNITDELTKLTQRICDAEAAVGSDAFTASLVIYQSGKLARTGDDMDNHLTGW